VEIATFLSIEDQSDASELKCEEAWRFYFRSYGLCQWQCH